MNRPKHLVAAALLVVAFLPLSLQAQSKRSVRLRFEMSSLDPSMSVAIEAGARYVIEPIPLKNGKTPQGVGPAFHQESDLKLSVRTDKNVGNDEVEFSFTPRDVRPGEIAFIEFPVTYTITGRLPDGSVKTMPLDQTFVLRDLGSSERLEQCLRVQGFPNQVVRVGIAECGAAWATPN